MATAIKIYKKLTSDYTVVTNQILKYNLSLKAIGLYLYIISKPDKWDFSRAGVAVQVADGESGIRTAIEELEKIGFLTHERTRNENGRMGSTYWIITDTPIKKPQVEKPHVDKPPVVKPQVDKTLQVSTIKVSTKEVNTNLFNEQVSSLPLRGKEDNGLEKIAESVVQHFKTVFGRTGGGKKATIRNLPYWLEEYTQEEIEQAISNSYHDEWWRDKLTLEILLRKRKPTVNGEAHEHVDRIAKFLAIQPKVIVNYELLTHFEVWQLANEFKISWGSARDKAKYLNDKIENKEFSTKREEELPIDVLRHWISAEMSKGRLKTYTEMEELELADMHPDKVRERAKLDAYKKSLRDRGEL